MIGELCTRGSPFAYLSAPLRKVSYSFSALRAKKL